MDQVKALVERALNNPVMMLAVAISVLTVVMESIIDGGTKVEIAYAVLVLLSGWFVRSKVSPMRKLNKEGIPQ